MKELSIYLVTWNVVGKAPSEDLLPLLDIKKESKNNDALPDIYAVGLQEVNAQPQAMLMDALFYDSWTKAFQEALAEFDFVKIKTERLQGILILIFAKRKHLLHIQGLQTNYTRTGLRGFWGNKGGVTVRFTAYRCSICIINCHLAAHNYALKQRIEEYNTILDAQMFNDPETETILYHDYIFWFGDLNFRLSDLEPSQIKSMIEKKEYDALFNHDQLHVVMKSGEAFSEFSEQRPNFPPTYKYFVGKHDYDLRRHPSWTDRILYKVNPDVYENVTLSIKQKSYRAHNEYTQSDHKPVSALFVMQVFEDFPDSCIIFEDIDKWYINETNVCNYTVTSSDNLSEWDWIGLYKVKFSSLEDYVTYVWASPKCDNEQQTTQTTCQVNFNEIVVPAGFYQLIYMNNDSTSIKGISKTFEITERTHKK